MQSLPSMFRKYVYATMAYGFTRAATYDYTGTQIYHNEVSGYYETKEILLTDSIGKVASGSFSAPFVWPLMLGQDLTQLECIMKGKNPKEYK
jgi:hypothetical protein